MNPLKSMVKFAGELGFISVSVRSWADGSLKAPASLQIGRVSTFLCNPSRSFWGLFRTSQETFSLVFQSKLSEWVLSPVFIPSLWEAEWFMRVDGTWCSFLHEIWQQGGAKSLYPQILCAFKLWLQWMLMLAICLHRLVLKAVYSLVVLCAWKTDLWTVALYLFMCRVYDVKQNTYFYLRGKQNSSAFSLQIASQIIYFVDSWYNVLLIQW